MREKRIAPLYLAATVLLFARARVLPSADSVDAPETRSFRFITRDHVILVA